jgi:manganese transport protein
VDFRIPVWVRRVATMVPTVLVIALGVNPTQTLVLSQVVLSLVLPIPLISLVKFTGRRDLMGRLVSGPALHALAVAATVVIVLLNVVLLLQTAGVPLPFSA